ncbi:MAG: pallilysin-related adhesin [Spirochaetaceae bacterium]|jgi:hypothetical protein|nr:pallilysin-related adhesin [Spirochaetaceae bacterium]
MKRITKIITIAGFAAALLAISALLILPRIFKNNIQRNKAKKNKTDTFFYDDFDFSSLRTLKAGEEPRITMEDSELVTSVLSGDFDADGSEEQIIAYRAFAQGQAEPSMYVTFIEYNEIDRKYIRLTNEKILVTRPGTLAIYTQDLIGNHKNCILITGINESEEKTLSVFSWSANVNGKAYISKLAEIAADGSISIEEIERSVAYRQGMANGASYTILVRSRDSDSGNSLDQIETNYVYNSEKGIYERSKTVKLPGARIEERTLRNVLGGSAAQFERFAEGLWYHVSMSGTVDNEQYIYIDTVNREIIFYSDATQQVYTWRNSSATRFGIYISSQNISVPTMNRIIDIELESIDSIRVRVFEDVRMRIQINAPWDGSYRRATAIAREKPSKEVPAFTDSAYTCVWGNLKFFPRGEFELTNGTVHESGNYAFFALEGEEILEFIPRIAPVNNKNKTAAYPLVNRETYRVERAEDGIIKLYRTRIGTGGLQIYHEPPLSLSPFTGEM